MKSKFIKYIVALLMLTCHLVVQAGAGLFPGDESTYQGTPSTGQQSQIIDPSINIPPVAPKNMPPKEEKEDQEEYESSLNPFGSNLFTGFSFTTTREDSINPEYIVQPGDRIALRIWGAITINELITVDAQGNIFIPEVGPIRIAGTRNAELNVKIKQAVEKVFTQNIDVYTNLQAPTPVLVFVTGFVNKPGSYAGVASDSILYFLERAGGIDDFRGSYRKISVLRDNKIIAQTDLYDFLIYGILPRPQFTDGDTIVVERRGNTVTAEGAVRNKFSFEIPENGITGSDLINYARPFANSAYVTVLGTRKGEPFSAYINVSELEALTLKDGDNIKFEVDQVHDTMLVTVEGSHAGQSKFSVPRESHLLELLDLIEIDPALADINSISLKRNSLKIRQKKAIEESLQRLEKAVMGRSAISSEGADILQKEAQLIANFVERARRIEPEGILVVANNDGISNVLLQPDDVILIPDNTNIVQVSGEVMVPQALVYIPGDSFHDYVERVGGFTEQAEEDKYMIMRRTGEVLPISSTHARISIKPGDEIIVLPEVPGYGVEIAKILVESIFRIAAAAAIFIRVN